MTFNRVMILDVPVLHQGYLKLFERVSSMAPSLYLPDAELVAELAFLEPEIRAIDPEVMRGLIESLNYFDDVRVLHLADIHNLTNCAIVTVDEGVSHRLVDRYYPGSEVIYENWFLRWDESNVTSQEPVGHDEVSDDPESHRLMALAEEQAERSADWWRQVGGVIVFDAAHKEHLLGHNQHVPSQLMPYVNGDPRDSIEAGTYSELSTALHLEQGFIAEAARRGLALEGASLYVTVFPCPACAKMIAYSGIKTVYFKSGHASLDGQTIMHARGVKLVLVRP